MVDYLEHGGTALTLLTDLAFHHGLASEQRKAREEGSKARSVKNLDVIRGDDIHDLDPQN